ncbi:gas vesicle protein [Yersinia enterocolitica]|uniref:gas vesicle protein n=1 Tax=Yersinia enterocolitica TaxID=630 RepID=UPI00336D4A0F
MDNVVGDNHKNQIQEVISYKMKDADLMYLASIANVGAGITITLFTKGIIISGTLTSGKEYYNSVASNLVNIGELGSQVAEYFSNAGKTLYTQDDNNSKELPLNFLHLKQFATHKNDGGLVHRTGSLLRVKIEEIDGYYLGMPS